MTLTTFINTYLGKKVDYKDEKFKKYVENKFSYDDNVLIASNQDVMKLISGEQEIVNDGIPDTDDVIDLDEDED